MSIGGGGGLADPMLRRRARVIWSVGVGLYFVAVLHRSSLAVAGIAASERFGINAAQLATFVTLQLLVYAAMQVPIGLLLDRFGPRSVLTAGALTLALGQICFALATSYPLAILARTFVGAGDAMTFICVLRLVISWFEPQRIPVITQWTGMTGQLGAIAAAAPMSWALVHLGWTQTYLIAASLGVLLLGALLAVVHDGPGARHRRGPTLDLALARRNLSGAWSHPGTRLGFWVHFALPFSSSVFGMLWGFPFLVQAEHLGTGTAATLLTVMVVTSMLAGPVIGWRSAVRPWHRSTLVIAVLLAIMLVWAVVLLWTGDAPLPLLVALVVVTGLGGPASAISFDLARFANPPDRLGSATGIVNQGGFIAGLVLITAIGLILDALNSGGTSNYTPESFRWAMSSQYVLWTLGLIQLLRYRRRTRSRLREEDPRLWSELSGLGPS